MQPKRNIVLKARQLGITTYVAARYYSVQNDHATGDADWCKWPTARNRRKRFSILCNAFGRTCLQGDA